MFFVVGKKDIQNLEEAVRRSAALLPLMVLLEGVMLACSIFGLRALYGRQRDAISVRGWVRAAAWGYLVGLVAPAGRAAGEAVRAVILHKEGGGPTAGLAAVRIQAVALCANGVASVIAAVATYAVVGPTRLTAFVAINAAVTGFFGAGLVFGQKTKIAAGWMRKLHGPAKVALFDEALSQESHLARGFLWEVIGRGFQWSQYTLVVVSVGGHAGVLVGLVAQGVHLVAASVGDLIPGQLGVSEANFALSSAALGMSGMSGSVIGVMIHSAQLLFMAVCGLVLLALRSFWSPVAAEAV
jgi:hypothetical protein